MNFYEISIKNWSKVIHTMMNNKMTYRGGSRAAATSNMECFAIIVNGLAVNYYPKALHLRCCSSPRSASEIFTSILRRVLEKHAPLKIKKT